MSGMAFRWKPAVHFPVAAQAAGEEMERLRLRHNGRLDPEMIVEAARNGENPLRSAFEWDDQVAGDRYRIDQASHMIRSIVVEIERPDAEATTIRAFVSVKRDEDRSYTSVAHALSDEELRQQVVAAALKELHDWCRRHQELVELAEVFATIDRIDERKP